MPSMAIWAMRASLRGRSWRAATPWRYCSNTAGTLGLVDLDYVHPSGARGDFQNNWGGEDLDALSRYDGLRAIRLTALGRYALGLIEAYQVPASQAGAWGLKVLPALDVGATGTVSAGDQLLLSAYAEHTAERGWGVSAASLLAAINAGRDLGGARVIECADPALAALITHDRALGALCYPIGERHLAVPLKQELKFRRALLKLGYVLPGQSTPLVEEVG